MVFLKKQLSRLLYPPLHGALARRTDTDGNEHFLLEQTLGAGWYMFECMVSTNSNLYITAGYKKETGIPPMNISELYKGGHDRFELLVRKNELAKRIIHLPTQVSSIRLEGEGIQHFKYLRIVRLRAGFAKKRMLRRIRSTEMEMTQKAVFYDCDPEAFLFGSYNHSFSSDYDLQYQHWLRYAEPSMLDSLSSGHNDVIDENDFILFSAPGYQVSPQAKQLMTAALLAKPSGKLVYADEDVINVFGVRSEPYFKPDWNPDLFYSRDYISSCYMCRRDWYLENEQIFRHYGECLALSYLLPSMSAEEILHLPVVLAHAEEAGMDDGRLHDYRKEILKDCVPGVADIEDSNTPGCFRLRYMIPEPLPMVSLLVPTRDGLSVLKPCVESILELTEYSNYEILILDNQSHNKETLDWFDTISEDYRVRVLSFDQEFNYSAINNFGVMHARGSIIGLINNDVEVISPDWLQEMVVHACRPEIGCVGAKLYYSDGRIQHAGVVLGLGDVAGHAHRFSVGNSDGYHGRLKLVQNYSAVTAACLLVRRAIFEEVGGLEEEYLKVAYNDVDFCLRVCAAGYRNLWTPYAELYHHESVSRGKDDTPEKKHRYRNEVAYMQKTWGEILKNDPYYNPNLSLRCEDFSIREFI